MTIGFTFRTAVSICAVCTAGVLALAPPGAAAGRSDAVGPVPGRPGAGSTAPARLRGAVPQPSLLQRSGTQVRPHADAPDLPDLSALSWLVADADTGEVLAAHDAHLPLPPASTLKTLFALTVLPALPGTLQHTVTAKDLEGIGAGSSLVGVAPGLTYSVSDLWRGVFLHSGNDAVHVLARLNGGWNHTARQMEVKARSLGALDTHVVSPDGYDAEGQVSSAYDLAVFGRAGLHNADFARYCSTAWSLFPGYAGSFGIRNTNRLLTGADGVEPYPGLIGIKNGYTSHAGNTLVSAARQHGRTLVATVMNPQEGDGLKVYEETRALLDWGFAAAEHVDPVGSLNAVRPATAPRPRSGPDHRPAPAAASPAAVAEESPWPETGAIAGAAGLGAGAVCLALRRRAGRAARR
ncbi:serine hydrolase [Streptomyces sp. NPDC046831]|uniref:D-alanyl-D-alanine carboxypeptidase family protein n=1 Tax=Streptomyces sp. NPDC046831 TaxID=3154805 RepID=UPI0033C3F513